MTHTIWIAIIIVSILALLLLISYFTRSKSGGGFDRKDFDKDDSQSARHDADVHEKKSRRRDSAGTRGVHDTTPPPPPPPPDPDDAVDSGGDSRDERVVSANGGSSRPDKALEVAAEDKDEVLCSVFAPDRMAKGDDHMVQVWLHLLEQSEEVSIEAKVQDSDASYRGKTYLTARLSPGDNVQVILHCDDVDIDEPEQFAVWNQRPENLSFFVSVPGELQKSALFFKVEIFHDGIPVGKLKFKVPLDSTAGGSVSPALVEADQFQEAFISYASVDRDAVLARVQGLKAAGKYRIFQDVMVLEQGEQWEPRLVEEINKCDVFFMFWSQNAKNSEWVKKEFLLALERKHGSDDAPPCIHPIPIEHPIVKPWEDLKAELGKYHLNDQTLYFMSVTSS